MRSGEKIRDYILEQKMGEGGMGEVWRALHSGAGSARSRSR